jgi:hypothetical protein
VGGVGLFVVFGMWLGGGGGGGVGMAHTRPAEAPKNTNVISYVLNLFSLKCATNCVCLDIATRKLRLVTSAEM